MKQVFLKSIFSFVFICTSSFAYSFSGIQKEFLIVPSDSSFDSEVKLDSNFYRDHEGLIYLGVGIVLIVLPAVIGCVKARHLIKSSNYPTAEAARKGGIRFAQITGAALGGYGIAYITNFSVIVELLGVASLSFAFGAMLCGGITYLFNSKNDYKSSRLAADKTRSKKRDFDPFDDGLPF